MSFLEQNAVHYRDCAVPTHVRNWHGRPPLAGVRLDAQEGVGRTVQPLDDRSGDLQCIRCTASGAPQPPRTAIPTIAIVTSSRRISLAPLASQLFRVESSPSFNPVRLAALRSRTIVIPMPATANASARQICAWAGRPANGPNARPTSTTAVTTHPRAREIAARRLLTHVRRRRVPAGSAPARHNDYRDDEQPRETLLGSWHAEQGASCQNEPYPTSPAPPF